MRYDQKKRLLDLAMAITLLILTLPLQIAIGVAVLLRLGRPALFRQIRPGLNGQPFELVKFRTMRQPDSARGWVDDASRMTKFGRNLRATSLDELPSLWNIVRGDMSIVGPRPLLMQYLARYTPEQARRNDVKPGLTGLAQISGRNGICWTEKLARDVEYVDNASFRVDIQIMVATVSCVLRQKGVTAVGGATMSEFLGVPDVGSTT